MYLFYTMNQNSIKKVLFVLILCASNFIFSVKLLAQGDLLLIPRRVIFEEGQRFQELSVVNIGKDTATYMISFVQIRMKSDGSFEQISTPDSGQYFADQYVRYFPRKVSLAPKESQAVKLQVSKSKELLPGEYRSHLHFRAVPKQEKALGMEDSEKKDSGLSIRLTPIYGISIPVILKAGKLEAQVKFSDLSFQIDKDSIPNLSITFYRTGNTSVYGDIIVDHISGNGKVTRVGNVKGLAVYSPISTRSFKLPLDNKPDINYQSGKLHITYTDQSTKPIELASSELILDKN